MTTRRDGTAVDHVKRMGRHSGFGAVCAVILIVTVLAWATGSSGKRQGDAEGDPIWRRMPLLQTEQPAAATATPTSITPDTTDCSCGWQQPLRTGQPVLENPLWAAFQKQTRGPLIRKWSPYFDVYHRYFQRFRGQKVTFLEIGVQSGGSITLWQTYFGADKLQYHGMDINPYTRELFHDPPGVNIIIADQGKREWWASFRKQAAAAKLKFDIILDDGGHTMQQQIVTYEEAWALLADGGVYICEDTATSFDTISANDYREGPPPRKTLSSHRYGGGWLKNGTWIEYAKQFADTVNGHYINQILHPDFDPLQRQYSVLSAAMYDQMVVLEKGNHAPANEVRAGTFSIPIGGKLQDGKVIPELLEQYRAKLAASLR